MRFNGNQDAKWKGLDKNKHNINQKWRPLSFRNQFKKFLDTDGKMKIPKENILKIYEDWSISVKLPTKEAIALKAINWAMSNKWTESTKMITWIVDLIDGKTIAWKTNDDNTFKFIIT